MRLSEQLGIAVLPYVWDKDGETVMNLDSRKNCPIRHENGNCLVCGGFCLAVNDSICEALHNAYNSGFCAAVRNKAETEEEPQ